MSRSKMDNHKSDMEAHREKQLEELNNKLMYLENQKRIHPDFRPSNNYALVNMLHQDPDLVNSYAELKYLEEYLRYRKNSEEFLYHEEDKKEKFAGEIIEKYLTESDYALNLQIRILSDIKYSLENN